MAIDYLIGWGCIQTLRNISEQTKNHAFMYYCKETEDNRQVSSKLYSILTGDIYIHMKFRSIRHVEQQIYSFWVSWSTGNLGLDSFYFPCERTMHVCVLSRFGHVWLFATLGTVACQAPLCPWDSAGMNTGVGCHALLQGIFLTQGRNSSLLGLLH